MFKSKAANSAQPAGHMPALDAIRGIALLMVVFHHAYVFSNFFMPNGVVTGIAGLLTAFFESGNAGVDLFFVLSGFLITGILLKTRDREKYFSHFYARRILRIFPLYYLFMFVFLVFIPAIITVPSESYVNWQRVLDKQEWFWLHLANLRLFLDGTFVCKYLDHAWSLAIEEQFYLVWPLIIWITPTRWIRTVIASLIVGALILRWGFFNSGFNKEQIYLFTLTRVDGLALGALLATFANKPDSDRHFRRVIMIGSLACVGLWGVSYLPMAPEMWKNVFGYTFKSVLFSVLVATTVLSQSSVRSFLEGNNIFCSVGKYSYGLYLWHQPIFAFSGKTITAWLFEITGNEQLSIIIFAFIGFAITFGVALVSFHYFEKHWLNLKHHFENDSTKKLKLKSKPIPGLRAG